VCRIAAPKRTGNEQYSTQAVFVWTDVICICLLPLDVSALARRRREHGDRHSAATQHVCNKLLGQLYYGLQHEQTFDEAKVLPETLNVAA
jgi:hypothetical protein